MDYDDDDPGDTNIYSFGLEITHVDGEDTDDDTELEMGKSFLVIFSSETREEYEEWVEENDDDPEWINDLPRVYSRLDEDNSDPEPDTSGLFGIGDDGNWNAPNAVTDNFHYGCCILYAIKCY